MSSSSVEGNNGLLVPWSLDLVEKRWNQYFTTDTVRFRVYTDKGTRRDSARKLTRLLLANRHWLNCGRGAPLDTLYDEFCSQLLIIGIWLNNNSDHPDAWAILGGPSAKTMGFWPFVGAHHKRDGLRNLSSLYGLATGQGPQVADKLLDQRRAKRDAIRALEGYWKEVVSRAVLKLDADQIHDLRPAVKTHCDELIEQVNWIAAQR